MIKQSNASPCLFNNHLHINQKEGDLCSTKQYSFCITSSILLFYCVRIFNIKLRKCGTLLLLVSWLQICNVLKTEQTCQTSSINEVIQSVCVCEWQKLKEHIAADLQEQRDHCQKSLTCAEKWAEGGQQIWNPPPPFFFQANEDKQVKTETVTFLCLGFLQHICSILIDAVGSTWCL